MRIDASARSGAPVAVFVSEGRTPPALPECMEAYSRSREDGFTGRLGQLVPARGGRNERYLFVGLGSDKGPLLDAFRKAAAAVVRHAETAALAAVTLQLPAVASPREAAQAAAEGALLGSYKFTTFQSAVQPPKLKSVHVRAQRPADKIAVIEGLKAGTAIGNAVVFARDLINRPPSDTTPEFMANVARSLSGPRVKVRIFDKKQIEKMGMGALLGVNRGSHRPPYFVHLTYKPAGRARRKIGICGKGITFDSGGLSLKPAASMETMKYDMAGAASVFSLFKILSVLKPPVEVHGFTPLTENMPGGNAVKPGDVLRTMRGRTIEVLNTDAEGRLVLADALSYASRQNLDEVLDIATLTGACVIALGTQIAALLGTDPSLTARFQSAARAAGEKTWELPLEKDYEPLLKSTVADIKNIGPVGQAGTIMAALFMKTFVDEGLPWLHIDIASTGWASAPSALSDTGATGVMIRSLAGYLLSYGK